MREWRGETEPLKWGRKHVHLFVCMWKLIYIHGKNEGKILDVHWFWDGLFVEFVCGHATEDYKCPRVLFTAEPESSICRSASWLNIIFKRMPLTFSLTSIFYEISSAIVAVAEFFPGRKWYLLNCDIVIVAYKIVQHHEVNELYEFFSTSEI